MNRNELPHKFNGSGTVVAAGAAVLSIDFLDVDGKPSMARYVKLRFIADVAFDPDSKIHYRTYPRSPATSIIGSGDYFFYSGDSDLSEGAYGVIELLNLDASEDAKVYIEASSDVDISGTTIS